MQDLRGLATGAWPTCGDCHATTMSPQVVEWYCPRCFVARRALSEVGAWPTCGDCLARMSPQVVEWSCPRCLVARRTLPEVGPAVDEDPPPLATSAVGDDADAGVGSHGGAIWSEESGGNDDRPKDTETTVPYCQESQEDRARRCRAYAELMWKSALDAEALAELEERRAYIWRAKPRSPPAAATDKLHRRRSAAAAREGPIAAGRVNRFQMRRPRRR